jgi:hypothetical protein
MQDTLLDCGGLMPGAVTTAQDPNTWRPDEPRQPLPAQRSAVTAFPGPSSAQDNNPARSVVDEPKEQTVPRKIMEKFQGLRPCLRKPCPWMDQCRNLHLPYSKSEQNIRFKKRCKFTPFRRVRPLFDSSDHQPSNGIKAGKNVPSAKGEPHETTHRQEEKNPDTSVKRGLPQEIPKEVKEAQIKIQDQVIFRGDAGSHQGYTGKDAEEKQEAVRGRKDNLYTTTSQRLALNYEQYPDNVSFHNQTALNDASNDANNREFFFKCSQ